MRKVMRKNTRENVYGERVGVRNQNCRHKAQSKIRRQFAGWIVIIELRPCQIRVMCLFETKPLGPADAAVNLLRSGLINGGRSMSTF
jgi:hypothetical protein